MRADTRIGRLRVAADGQKGVPTARALVEDALRTCASAAGPAARRGLLVVRRLDAGRAQTRADRRAVAQTVGDGLAEAARRAVRATDPKAGDAEAVLFRDPLEPYALYARALFARSSDAQAWFFRAVFGTLPRTPVPVRARTLLHHAATEPFAPAAMTEVFRAAGNDAPALLRTLPERDIPDLLVALGLSTSVSHQSPVARTGATPASDPAFVASTQARLRDAPAPLREMALDAIRETGPATPRTRLATALALLSASQADVSDAQIPIAIRAIQAGRAQGGADRETPGEDHGGAARTHPQETPEAARDPGTAASPSRPADASGDPSRRRRQRHEDTARPGEHPEAGHPEPATERPARSKDSAAPGEARSLRRGPSDPAPAAVPDAPGTGPDARKALSPETADPPGTAAADAPGQAQADAGAPDGHARPEASLQDPPEQAPQDATLAQALPFGAPTGWAGLVLIISLMNRLVPRLLDGGVGLLLLQRALDRTACPPGDPVRTALGQRPLAPADDPMPVRPVDLSALAHPLWPVSDPVIHPVRDHPGWRALTCARGRLVLAIWHGRAPAAIRRGLAIRPRRGQPLAHVMQRALTTAELGIRAAARAMTGTHVRALLGRSGWVRATRSHLDVTFDAALVDLSIRRAGLDIDPGWCRWLFSVVSIHYDYEVQDA